MIEIIADVETIIEQAILSFVATVNEGGTPSLSPQTAFSTSPISHPRTILNWKRNPAIEINVVDIFPEARLSIQGPCVDTAA